MSRASRCWVIFIIASASLPAIADMHSDSQSSAVVRDVRAIYERINSDIEERAAQQIDFVANPDESNPYEPQDWYVWTDKARKPDSTVAARIYVIGGNPRKAIVQVNSLSGDWVYQTEYYYYNASGQVAFIFEKNVTSNGYIVKRGAP